MENGKTADGGEEKFVSKDWLDIIEEAGSLSLKAVEKRKLEFESLAENSPDLIHRFDLDLKLIYVNKAITEITGFPPEIWLNRDPRECGVSGEFIQNSEKMFKTVLETGKGIETEFQFQTLNGLRFFISRIVPEFDNGKIVSLLAITSDMTRQKAIEMALMRSGEELRLSEQRFRHLTDAWPQMAWTAKTDGTIDYVNKPWLEYSGINREEVLGLGWMKIIHPTDRHMAGQVWMNAVKTGEKYECHYRMRRQDGEYRWFLARGVPQKDENGNILKWLGTSTDIHEEITTREKLEKALEKLKASEARLLDAQKLAHIGSFMIDFENQSVEWTDEMFHIFEREKKKKEPLFNELLENYLPAEILDAIYGIIKPGAKAKKILESEFSFNPGSEELKHLSFLCKPVLDEQGGIQKLFGTMMDITERRMAQDKLERSFEELERSNRELEQFAYIASHDMQEPLRTIVSFNQLLARRYKGRLDETADEYIGFIVDAARRMQLLINDLLIYSRATRSGNQSEMVNINKIIEDIKIDFKVIIAEKNAEIELGDLPEILADPVHIRQLFQNFIYNAIKFNESGRPFIQISARYGKGEYTFSIKDNGIGIEGQYHQRVFEIFQRLHQRDKYPGTGIGLAICKKIVERYGGSIWVESEPGRGAEFFFTMPVK